MAGLSGGAVRRTPRQQRAPEGLRTDADAEVFVRLLEPVEDVESAQLLVALDVIPLDDPDREAELVALGARRHRHPLREVEVDERRGEPLLVEREALLADHVLAAQRIAEHLHDRAVCRRGGDVLERASGDDRREDRHARIARRVRADRRRDREHAEFPVVRARLRVDRVRCRRR